MRSLVFTFLISLLLLNTTTQAQTKNAITGKVIDSKNAESLIGATITVRGTTLGASTDFNGQFSIPAIPVGNYTLEVKSLGYETKVLTDVVVKQGDVINLTVGLEQKDNKLKTVTVTGSFRKESENALLSIQKNSVSVSDGVSADLIKRTPDKSTSDVLKRVSGASIQDNKFAIVRGLNDRYNAALLNGAPLPSSEPDRKAFAFDIFPSAMLDNLIIAKTATPDMPGEFAGGIIQINTKDVPDKDFYSLSLGSGYNNITTGQTKLAYSGGKLDWLGIDDGTRAIPKFIPGTFDYPLNPLTQAQLAEKTNFDWAIHQDKSFAPNVNFQYAMGITKPMLKKQLAMVFAATYNKSNTFTETVRRNYTGGDTSVSIIQNDYLDKTYSSQVLDGVLANFSYKLNKNNSLSFKNLLTINSENKITNRTGAVDASSNPPIIILSNNRFFVSNKIYSGQLSGENYEPKTKIKLNWLAGLSMIQRSIPNERRTIYTRYKEITDTAYPNPKDTMWVAGISSSNVGPDYGGGMFWSQNNEQIKSLKVNLSRVFTIGNALKNEVKGGVFLQSRDREFFARRLGYTKYGGSGSAIKFVDSLLYLPEDKIFSAQNLGRIDMVGNVTKTGGFKLTDATMPSDMYLASSNLNAAFLMFDNKYKFLRLIWGARYESFKQTLDARRSVNTKEDIHLRTLKNDLLPSGNMIVSITKKQNIRIAYSQTLNRPEYRELAPFAFYDFTTRFVVTGRDTLKRAKIYNYDLRYELYPGKGQLLSVSGFYKKFEDPIEQILLADVEHEISYQNLKSATNYGGELEMRFVLSSLTGTDSIMLLNNLTLFSNLAIIRSSVNTANISGIADTNRPLQGQSPYVFNGGLQYKSSELGTTVSMSFNRVGSRIYVVGNQYEPAIWEAPRSFLDFQVAQSFFKDKLEIKLNAQNVLAQNQLFYQNKKVKNETISSPTESQMNKVFIGDRNNLNGYNPLYDDLIWSTRLGSVYSIGISVKL